MKLSFSDKSVFVLSFLLVAALYWGLWKSDGLAQEVEILVEGKIQYILDLQEDKIITVQGTRGDSIIKISDGQVRFVSSHCNTSFCVRNGWQKNGGDFIACLPNGVSFYLKGGKKVYDAINF